MFFQINRNACPSFSFPWCLSLLFLIKCKSFITRAIEDSSNDRMICPVCPAHTLFCFSCERAWGNSSPNGVLCGHLDCSNVTRFKILQEALLKVPILFQSLLQISMRSQFENSIQNCRLYHFVRPYSLNDVHIPRQIVACYSFFPENKSPSGSFYTILPGMLRSNRA